MDINEKNITNEKSENIPESKDTELSEEIHDDNELNDKSAEKNKEPVISFEFNIKNEEEEQAFLIYQKKYVYKHNWMITILFGIVALMFIISIVKNPGGYLNYILCVISLSVIFVTWYNTRRIRKYLMQALKSLEDDRYIFTLFDDSFKIETVITEEEKAEEDFVPVQPRTVKFGEEDLNVIENDQMFIIIVKKETIYVLAKRVLDDEHIETLRQNFIAALGEDFQSM